MDDPVRHRLDRWAASRTRVAVDFHAGRSRRLDELARLDDRFGDITDGGALGQVRSELAETEFAASKDALQRLATALEAAVLTARTRSVDGRLAEAQTAATAVVDGRERTVHEWRARLPALADTTARHDVERAVADADRRLAELGHERFEAAVRARRELGYGSVGERFGTIYPHLDLAAWGARARHLLDATETAYHDALRPLLAEARTEPHRASRGDGAYLAELPAFRSLFPKAKAEDALSFTLDGLGIAPRDRLGIAIDCESRPHKRPEPSCAGVEVPGDIALVLAPRDGCGHYAELLELAGRALPLAYTSPALPVERRRLADPALGCLWGLVVRGFLGDDTWQQLGPPGAAAAAPFARAWRFRRLLELRIVAARACWQLDLAAAADRDLDLDELIDRLATALTDATALDLEHRGDELALEVATLGHDLDAVHRLRAQYLEPLVTDRLRDEFGRALWRSPAAGGLLKELWNTGGTYTVEELAAELGIHPGEAAADTVIASYM